jgi:UDP:flavonoid glycosyltransferase YjiC (YdhE family)
VEVVCTIPSDADRAALGAPPPNARVEGFVPQAELLPRCAAVVHHGGAGTTFGSLAHGLPQVIVPQGADNFRNAALVAAAGASRTVLPGEVSEAAIRDAVRAVLDDRGGYRTAAQRVAAEIAAMPSPHELATALRAWAAGG